MNKKTTAKRSRVVAEDVVVGNVDGERRGGRRTSVVIGIGAGCVCGQTKRLDEAYAVQ